MKGNISLVSYREALIGASLSGGRRWEPYLEVWEGESCCCNLEIVIETGPEHQLGSVRTVSTLLL